MTHLQGSSLETVGGKRGIKSGGGFTYAEYGYGRNF